MTNTNPETPQTSTTVAADATGKAYHEPGKPFWDVRQRLTTISVAGVEFSEWTCLKILATIFNRRIGDLLSEAIREYRERHDPALKNDNPT
jgi:hypothetical protein